MQRFDYAPSLDAFVARNIDACTMTNMEALDMPAASGVPTTAILIGDYSNGNDALLVRNGLQMKDLAGKKMLLVQKTVSEYLFDRAMTMNGLRDQIKQVRLINTSDSDIATAFISDTSASAVGHLEAHGVADRQAEGHHVAVQFVADSRRDSGPHRGAHRRARTPDGAGQKFAKALAGAWYEMLALMSAQGSGGRQECWPPSPKARRIRSNPTKSSSAPPRCSTRRNPRLEFGASADLETEDGAGAAVLLRSRPAGREYQVGGRRGDPLSRRHRCRARPTACACVFDLAYMQMAAQGKL